MAQSLMFYQNTKRIQDISMSQLAGGGAYATSMSAVAVAGRTLAYNTECNKIVAHLAKFKTAYATRLAKEISAHPGEVYDGMREKGVSLAWKYEKADIQMGGRGSGHWNKAQRAEILNSKTHTVRGRHGHHINNVNDHPEEQTNPDNIKFLSRTKHLEAHEGDWKNSTEGKMIDKEKMLRRTNLRRVIKNEVVGIAAAALIGFGIGFAIGTISTLAINGFSPENVKIALTTGLKTGAKATIVSAISYGIGRIVTEATQHILTNLGIQLTEKLSNTICAGVTGTITVLAFAVVEFIMLKKEGKTTKDAILSAGKHALFSLAGMGLSLFLGYIGGPVVGVITSVTILGVTVTHGVVSAKKEIKTLERVNIETVNYMRPSFA